MEVTESFEGVKEVHVEVVDKDQKKYEEGAALSLPAFDLNPKKGICFFYRFSPRYINYHWGLLDPILY